MIRITEVVDECGTEQRRLRSVVASEGRLWIVSREACNRAPTAVTLTRFSRDGLERLSETGSNRARRTDVPVSWDCDRWM